MLTLLVLYVRDIEASRQFYTGLGLRCTAEHHHHPSPAMAHPAAGRHATWATTGTTVTDPDGNRIELV